MKKDISANLYQKCLILCSKILLNVRVGHLIMTALAIWASDPQNALAQMFTLFLVFPCITGSSRDIFILFLIDNCRNSGNIFPHFGWDQFTPFFNLPGEHPLIRMLGKYRGKQFTHNVVEHTADWGLLLWWKLLFEDLKPQENTMEALYISNTVEPSISNHPKCQAQAVTYWRWSLTKAYTILGQNFAQVAYGNYRDLPHDWNGLKYFIHVKSRLRETMRYFHLRNFRLLYYRGMWQFTLYYLSSGRLWEVKNKRKFQAFSLKSGHGRL